MTNHKYLDGAFHSCDRFFLEGGTLSSNWSPQGKLGYTWPLPFEFAFMINLQLKPIKINLFNLQLNKAYLKIFLVIFTLGLIGLFTVGNYGVTWDEWMEIDMVQWVKDFIFQRKPIPIYSEYYGFIFNFVADELYKIVHHLGFNHLPPDVSSLDLKIQNLLIFREKMEFKHIFTFLFSLLTYGSVAGIVAILAGVEYAWIAPIILALFPQFWGHSFFNPKDIPFATLFTIATFLGSCLVGYYIKAADQDTHLRIGKNKLTLYSILYGVILGLVTGIRVAGFLVMFFVIIAHLLTKIDFKVIGTKLKSFLPFYGLIFLVWTVTSTLVYPASWDNPVKWFLAALASFSKYSIWDNSVLFDGEYIPGKSLPWYYIPRLLSITIPILFQVSFLLGLVGIVFKYRKLSEAQRACVILVLFQIFFLPVVAILKNSTIYDGLRHFIFIIPGIAAISATTLIWIYQALPNKHIKLFALVVLIIQLSPIVVDMIALHPYEYAYFNRSYGGLPVARKYQETDYWGLSLREGMEWLNKNAEPRSTIVVAGPLFAAEIFADPHLQFNVIYRDEFPWGKAPNPDYYMALPRSNYDQALPECPIIYSVTRQNTPLTVVKQCGK